jgi:hypothetical protein
LPLSWVTIEGRLTTRIYSTDAGPWTNIDNCIHYLVLD